MSFAVGTLVRARGREWVVLPESSEQVVMLRPLGGTDDEITGIHLGLEQVEPATFSPPNPEHLGDYRSCKLLRDAVRLGIRSSAGPFRSFGRIGVEPRPYQLVPLLMALRLDPVRLLIADDVGIGKTVEAGLVARELLDRGEIQRLAVLCPPALAEQWQAELRDKFHIEAELVLSGTAGRLERDCRVGESLFDRHRYVVVSTDFIKSDRRRHEFLRTCPECVIVDEAHTCSASDRIRGRNQRYELLKELSDKESRHLILVTATPHSGKEDTFRSLIGLLDPQLRDLPEDLTGRENEKLRQRLARYMVQRRRIDIRRYLDTDTPFPEREEKEESYLLSEAYHKLFDKVLEFARETVDDPEVSDRRRQRVRWWSALGLLRALASSPAAAAETLRQRALTNESESADGVDEAGRRMVLDLGDAEPTEGMDMVPGVDEEPDETLDTPTRRRLRALAKEADALRGAPDAKLQSLFPLVEDLLRAGFNPIVFCRFIQTAEYVAEALRGRLSRRVDAPQVMAVTGLLAPAEREERVAQLAQADHRVLVCTDCLSEGINLQHAFDAVVHYDLSWNPTRHEQREGRVDRYGQASPKIRVLTYYGRDNGIDGIVLEVLLRKEKAIRGSLGYSVPVPENSETVFQAIMNGALVRRGSGGAQQLGLFDVPAEEQRREFHGEWELAADREKRFRTVFAQERIRTDEVRRELDATRRAIGSAADVRAFLVGALEAHGATVSQNGTVHARLDQLPRAAREAMGGLKELEAAFDLPVRGKALYLPRTHPVLEGLASYLVEMSLDDPAGAKARRCGVIQTRGVTNRTTLLLLRHRFHLITRRARAAGSEAALLAEDIQLLGFEGSPEAAGWLDAGRAEELMGFVPDQNVDPERSRHFLSLVQGGLGSLAPHLEQAALERAEVLREAHARVREEAKLSGTVKVEPLPPADLIGLYVFLPASSAGHETPKRHLVRHHPHPGVDPALGPAPADRAPGRGSRGPQAGRLPPDGRRDAQRGREPLLGPRQRGLGGLRGCPREAPGG